MQKIYFRYIPGIKNTLADTLSRLIEIDDDIKLPLEEESKELGYFPFKELPPVITQVTEEILIGEIDGTEVKLSHTEPVKKNLEIELPPQQTR